MRYRKSSWEPRCCSSCCCFVEIYCFIATAYGSCGGSAAVSVHVLAANTEVSHATLSLSSTSFGDLVRRSAESPQENFCIRGQDKVVSVDCRASVSIRWALRRVKTGQQYYVGWLEVGGRVVGGSGVYGAFDFVDIYLLYAISLQDSVSAVALRWSAYIHPRLAMAPRMWLLSMM